jgi:hypothetical protein
MSEPRRWTLSWSAGAIRVAFQHEGGEKCPELRPGEFGAGVEVVEASAYDAAAEACVHNANLAAEARRERDLLAARVEKAEDAREAAEREWANCATLADEAAARVEGLVKSQELAVLDRNEAEDENVRLAARVRELEGAVEAWVKVRDRGPFNAAYIGVPGLDQEMPAANPRNKTGAQDKVIERVRAALPAAALEAACTIYEISHDKACRECMERAILTAVAVSDDGERCECCGKNVEMWAEDARGTKLCESCTFSEDRQHTEALLAEAVEQLELLLMLKDEKGAAMAYDEQQLVQYVAAKSEAWEHVRAFLARVKADEELKGEVTGERL